MAGRFCVVGVGRGCSGLFGGGRGGSGQRSIWSGRFWVVGDGRVCTGLFGDGRGGQGGVLSGRGNSGWSELVGFVQVCSEVVGAAFYLVGAILCGRSWSDLFRFGRRWSGWLGRRSIWSGRFCVVGVGRGCTGLVGSGRGACRWASVGPLFCCGERRYHGAGGVGRGRGGGCGADSRSGGLVAKVPIRRESGKSSAPRPDKRAAGGSGETAFLQLTLGGGNDEERGWE